MLAGLTIEIAGTAEDSFQDVFGLLLGLHREGGYAHLNRAKAEACCRATLAEGMVLLARGLERKPIGTLGLTEMVFWYADRTYLQDAWFFVSPEFRRDRVGVALLNAAKPIAQQRNALLFVTQNNPDRRAKATPMTVESQLAGYVPLGYTLKVS